MEIRRFGVVGAGTMGNGIAQVFAQAGLDGDAGRRRAGGARARPGGDRQEPRAAGGEGQARRRRARRGARPASARPASLDALAGGRPRGRGGGRALRGQARRCFATLDAARPGRAPSSPRTPRSISITEARRARPQRPDQVIGMHFMNPVPVMKLVEIIRGLATTQATYDAVEAATARARQDAGRGERLPRLRLQPRADADDQRGDLLPARRASARRRRSTR